MLESAVPEGASVVDQKWTYDLTSKTSSSSSSMSGWTKYDTKRSGWGSTQGPVYSNPSNGSRNVWSEQYVASTTTHYVYYHRYKSNQWSYDAHASSWARHSGPDVTSPLPNGYYSSVTGQRYSGAACSVFGASNQWHLKKHILLTTMAHAGTIKNQYILVTTRKLKLKNHQQKLKLPILSAMFKSMLSI